MDPITALANLGNTIFSASRPPSASTNAPAASASTSPAPAPARCPDPPPCPPPPPPDKGPAVMAGAAGAILGFVLGVVLWRR